MKLQKPAQLKKEPEGWVVHGYIRRGPDYSQKFTGWKVTTEPEREDDVPVTLVEGHIQSISYR